MKKLAGILYVILLIIVVVTIATDNFNASVMKVEALLFIAITVISSLLTRNTNNG